MKIDYIKTDKHNLYNVVITTTLQTNYNLNMFNRNYAIYVDEYNKNPKTDFKQIGMAVFMMSNPLSNELMCDIIFNKNVVTFIFKNLSLELLQVTVAKFFNVMSKKPTAKSLKAMKDKTNQLLKVRFGKLDIKKSDIPFKDFFLDAYANAYKLIVNSNILIVGPEIHLKEDKIKINNAELDKTSLKDIKLELKKPKFKILKIDIQGSDLFKYIILNLAKTDIAAKIGNDVVIEYWENAIYAYTNDHINLNNSNINELTKKYTDKFKEPKIIFSENDIKYNMIIDNIISNEKNVIKQGKIEMKVF